MDTICIVSSCLVRMASNGGGDDDANQTKIHELTPWDLYLLSIGPIQRGLLFRYHHPSQNTVDHLSNSLSRTLDFFPPLSGRLCITENDDNTTSYHVDCNDAGVEFSHAVAQDVAVSDVLEARYVPEIVSSFFPLNDYANREGTFKPLIGVRVTVLADGFFVGCAVNHCVVDGTSFWHFLNSWAEISRGLDKCSKPPIFDRWLPSSFNNENPRIRLPRGYLNSANDHPQQPPTLGKFFKFSKESLAKLKAQVNEESRGREISTFQALLAHVWCAILRSQHPDIACDDTVRNEKLTAFRIPIGARPRIPLPDEYFGSAVHAAVITIKVQEVVHNGLAYVARKFNQLIHQHDREATIKFVENWLETPMTTTSAERVDSAVGGSHRHNVYGCDFGWGKPVAVRSGRMLKYDGKITVYPALEPGGIDVEVSLVRETMKILENDASFMEMVTV